MEEQQPVIDNLKSKKTIKVKQLLQLTAVVVAVIACIFGYYYWKSWQPEIGSIINMEQPPHYLFSIYGSDKQALKSPMAAFVSRNGKIYVSDTENHQIQVFSPNGKYLFTFGKPGRKSGEFSYPYGITENEEGNLLIAETGNQRIQEFTPEGKFIRTVAAPAGAVKVEKPGPLYHQKGKLYIGDLVKHEVIVADDDGKVDLTIKNVSYPHGIAVDNQGKIYISDAGGYRIRIVDRKGQEVKNITGVNGDGGFSALRGLALDNKGRIYVADSIASAIRVFEPGGEYLFSFGTKGYGQDEFLFPAGVFIDQSNRIVVADWANNRVEIWGY